MKTRWRVWRWSCPCGYVYIHSGTRSGTFDRYSQLHHVPALFTHPSRRVRQLAVNLHAALLASPSLTKEVSFLLNEGASADHADFILGSWLLASNDIDRQVSGPARDSWNAFITLHSLARVHSSSSKLTLDSSSFGLLWEFVQRVLLDPSGVYLQINPPQPVLPISAPQSRKGSGKSTPVPKRGEEPVRSRADEEEESEADRKARLRISGFGALEWILSVCYASSLPYMSADQPLSCTISH